jgi:GT2 family glycosyltransferase/SAM-dependent methyltransferase/glycosyltransferase involved in cell wall biosynthesis
MIRQAGPDRVSSPDMAAAGGEPGAPDAIAPPPQRLIEWTGERMVPWAPDLQVVYEHLHRYAFATRFVEGARVLDLAAGEGYGVAMLADAAKEVVGVDIDADTVRHARRSYRRTNVRFELGSIIDPRLLDGEAGSFDVVTCFEAIEHVERQDILLANVHRLLRPGGLFIVSTPDRDVYNEGKSEHNPFHAHELDVDEFTELLQAQFSHVALTGQALMVGSVLATLDADRGTKEVMTATREDAAFERWSVEPGFRPMYLIALASDDDLPDLPVVSVLRDQELLAIRLAEGRAAAAAQALAERDSTLAAELSALQQSHRDLDERSVDIDRREQRISDLEDAFVVKGLRRYRAVIERSLPKGTRRRATYTEAVRTLRNVASRRWRAPLNLHVSPTPRVSVVIPVHGRRATTEQCLRALPFATRGVAKEVIVVDDASPDDTRAWLAGVVGATVIPLDDNVGFLRACNAGMAVARGEYLLLLNNDTIPMPGSIDRLAEVLDEDATIGVVGAKLLNSDGTLQEAGALLWNDGTGWNVGRGGDPASPEFNYRRDVDYCSAAALMVRRSLWRELGGFDERYAPAYYEDADLCFAARAAGYRVVYEPGAVVVHLEGVSHGVDLSSGVKQYQAVNRVTFVDKWADELADQYAPLSTNVPLAKQRVERGRLFVADAVMPTFDRDGGSLRMYRLLGLLRSMGFGVTFLADDRNLVEPYTSALLKLGVEVIGGATEVRALLRALAPELDAIVLSRRSVAWSLLDTVTDAAPEVPLVFDTVDLHFRREEHEARIGPAAAGRARVGRERELALMRLADQVWVVSGEEKDLIERLLPDASVAVVPIVHDPHPTTTPFEQRSGLLFVAGFRHAPNVDAALWLLDDILPTIRQALGPVPVQLVGSDVPQEVVRRADEHTIITGWVPDLGPLYEQSRLAIAPLRYGAGMKGKVSEALAYGVPVVTTSVGVDGMAPGVCAEAIVADSAPAFAEAVADIYQDRDRWEQIHRSAPGAVGAAYGAGAVRSTLDSVLREVTGRRSRRSSLD